MTQDQHKLEPVAHVHSNGDFCADRQITSKDWPVYLYTEAQVNELRAHLQQRPLPVREHLYDIVPPSAAEWFADSPGIANHDWRGGWDACRNRCRTLVDERLSAPSLPVREEPTAWRVRGYNQFKTSAPGPWRYFDGPTKPRVNIPSDCDFEPLFAPSPSVQNMGEGETGKDGVDVPLAPSSDMQFVKWQYRWKPPHDLDHVWCDLHPLGQPMEWYRDDGRFDVRALYTPKDGVEGRTK